MATKEADVDIERARMWNERYAAKEYVWAMEPNQFAARHLEPLPPGRAVDLGAGEGRNAVWLASRGWKVAAVDFSSVGLEKGARLAAEHDVPVGDDGVTFVEADALAWEPDEPLDLVVLSYLQLPSAERRSVLERARRWLAPDGVLFVVAHDQANVERGHGGPPSAEVCYTVEETVGALEGLEIELAEIAERVVATDDGEKVALDTVVLARRPAETT